MRRAGRESSNDKRVGGRAPHLGARAARSEASTANRPRGKLAGGINSSTDTVAAFRFGRVSESYASQKGDDRNVGVIGVAVFEEQGASFTWNAREIDRRHAADPFPGTFSEPPPNALTF